MSRIGKKPIPVPKGVKVDITGTHVKVTGPKGTLERDISPAVKLVQDASEMTVQPGDESKETIALQGLTRSLVNNMVVGVEQGFQKKLLIEGVGYKAEVAGAKLTLNVGYSNPVEFQLPAGVSAEVDKSNAVTLSAIDKELLGLTAARIRQIRKPEPYKGKGIRYENEHIVRKVGKSGAKA
jgi:large subunit ribosomal protein L6